MVNEKSFKELLEEVTDTATDKYYDQLQLAVKNGERREERRRGGGEDLIRENVVIPMMEIYSISRTDMICVLHYGDRKQ